MHTFFSRLTKEELEVLLREGGLSVSGKRAELVAMLVSTYNVLLDPRTKHSHL